jgi:hypothetical protein
MIEWECTVKIADEDDGYTIEHFTFECDEKLSHKETLDIAHEKVFIKYGDYIELGLEILR